MDWYGYDYDYGDLDYDYGETDFVKEEDRPFTHKGVRYVFSTNLSKGDKYYKLYKRLQQTREARVIFRRRAYALNAKGPEDAIPKYVAAFVAEDDLPKVNQEVYPSQNKQVKFDRGISGS
ncbi:MAG: hypothetical protein FJ044_05230 [Candidatus Cloacimonetes bacterium]|nr:hypothetical protein [Candidatus Cloacimonadota bacterium]